MEHVERKLFPIEFRGPSLNKFYFVIIESDEGQIGLSVSAFVHKVLGEEYFRVSVSESLVAQE